MPERNPLRRIGLGALLPLLLSLGWAASVRARQAPPPSTLDGVLAALTQAAPTIHSLSADAAVDDYTALVDDHSRSSGKFYFQRADAGPMYALDLTQPKAAAKELIYRDQAAYVYTPASHQVVKYPLAGQQSAVNEYLTLGVGATGRDLTRDFEVKLAGTETVDGQATIKLVLTPHTAGKVTSMDLWYDPRIWVAVQQQITSVGGDFHLITYRHVALNPHLDSKFFSTRFPGATLIVQQP